MRPIQKLLSYCIVYTFVVLVSEDYVVHVTTCHRVEAPLLALWLSLPRSLTLIPHSGRQPTWRAFIYYSKPEDMILGNLLLLVLSIFSASVLATDSDHDGTRIANRTIERVRLLFFLRTKKVLNILMCQTRRLFDCRRTRYLHPTSTKTFKIGAS